ncbi:MAG TPA: glycosyltransferase, partial [Thermoplasmata archaeon]|nr:glycosyltransferase [Thermoplasmata archaeon]
MKVAMVTPYWFPVRGGVTTFVADLSATLRSMGHEVRVFAREGGGEGATELGGAGSVFARRAAEALASFR